MQVDRDQNPEPDRIMPEQNECRRDQRQNDDRDFHEIQKEPQKEDEDHAKDQRACCAARHVAEDASDTLFPAKADEDQAEDARGKDCREDH